MMTPGWILDILAALMLVVAAISAARLVAAQPWRRGAVITDSDISHLLMAIAMAGMLASSLTSLPNTAWEVVFALLTAWFAGRVVLDARANSTRALAVGHCAPHLVHSAAMLYMFLALTAGSGSGMSGMGGMGGSSGAATQTLRYPTLAFAFALILVGYSIWDLDQLSGKRYRLPGASVSLASAVAAGVTAMADAKPAAAAFPAAQAAADSALPGTALAGQPASPGDTEKGSAPGRDSGARAWLLSPGTTVGCRIAMGVTMAFMLFIMI